MKQFYVIIILIISSQFGYSQVCVNPATNNCSDIGLGTSQFLMTTSNNVSFVFDEMREYIAGITQSGSTTLRLKVDETVVGDCKWKLIMYIDNNGTLPVNNWETLISYGSSGNIPELDLIEVKVYNGCGTPLQSGIYQIFTNNLNHDILEIIPESVPRVMPAPCDGSQVNGPGSYLTDYNEFTFNIDYRIKPGYLLRSGAYEINIRFCLTEY